LDVIFKYFQNCGSSATSCDVIHAHTAPIGNLEIRNEHLGQTCTTNSQIFYQIGRRIFAHRCERKKWMIVDAYKDAGRDPERQAYQEKARHPHIIIYIYIIAMQTYAMLIHALWLRVFLIGFFLLHLLKKVHLRAALRR
jgi:hypothetical protein